MATETITYEALEFHRGIVVFEMPARTTEAEGFVSLDDAQLFANRMNRWRKSKPTPNDGIVFNFTIGGFLNSTYSDDNPPNEFHLYEMIDRIYDAERKLDLLSFSMRNEQMANND